MSTLKNVTKKEREDLLTAIRKHLDASTVTHIEMDYRSPKNKKVDKGNNREAAVKATREKG